MCFRAHGERTLRAREIPVFSDMSLYSNTVVGKICCDTLYLSANIRKVLFFVAKMFCDKMLYPIEKKPCFFIE